MSSIKSFLRKFFKDGLNETIVTLLMAAPLRNEERFSWIKILPIMTSEEKVELKDNLEREIELHERKEARISGQLEAKFDALM